MATGSGLSTQFGLAEESTVGTAVTVTRFYEIDDLKPDHQKITKTSNGLRAGARGHRERNRVKTGVGARLVVPFTVQSKGLGVFLKHAMGATTTAQIGVTLTYRQIHLAADLTGKGLTLQGGFAESYTGTVRPYTYNGAKVDDWQLSCQMDDLLKANFTFDAWNWTTATSLASASYLAALETFHFGQLTTSIGGTPSTSSGRTTVAGGAAIKGLRAVTLKGNNNLRTDRRVAGTAGVKLEQLENNFREYTGDLDLEYADRTQLLDLYDADTSTCLVFTWTGVTDDGSGNKPVLRVIYPKVKFDAGTPDTSGPDIVNGKVSFTAYEQDDGSNPLIQLEYESQDTTP